MRVGVINYREIYKSNVMYTKLFIQTTEEIILVYPPIKGSFCYQVPLWLKCGSGVFFLGIKTFSR